MKKRQNKENEFIVERCKPFDMGVSYDNGGMNFSISMSDDRLCELLVFYKDNKELCATIPFPEEYRMGNVYSLRIANFDYTRYEYLYKIKYKASIHNKNYEEVIVDPYTMELRGREKWGTRLNKAYPFRSGFAFDKFDWENDKILKIPFDDLIIYELHVRGFTKHKSSQVEARGSFQGLVEKIPYLKELGINCVQLMPIYEFDEIMNSTIDINDRLTYRDTKMKKKINYWGYSEAFYFAPKASYAYSVNNQIDEFKTVIKEMHKNGIEVIIEFFFLQNENREKIIDCLRYWAYYYHVDGFKLTGTSLPLMTIATDPLLAECKIISDGWDTHNIYNQKIPRYKNLGYINASYRVAIRKYMKSDANMVGEMSFRIKDTHEQQASINYITGHNGFTLMDLVSYDIKHNEENGEDNRDGCEENYSWNCGVEGKTRKLKINQLRKKQIKNALLILLISKGTPLLLAGDEFCNSQLGNNNPYCQDNEITWLNWDMQNTHRDIYEFTKKMINFRKSHPILYTNNKNTIQEMLEEGIPDISFHGTKAWYSDFSYYNRCLGILYCGKYNKIGYKSDSYIYIAINMFWEEEEFDLPTVKKGMNWYIAVNTEMPAGEEFLDKEKGKIKKQDKQMVKPRSIIIFIAE